VTSARIVSDAFFFDFSHATCDGVKNTATRSVFFSFTAAIVTSVRILCTDSMCYEPAKPARKTPDGVPYGSRRSERSERPPENRMATRVRLRQESRIKYQAA
jgi:hypothetical protein